MNEQTLESFVKDRIAGRVLKPTAWISDGKIMDGISIQPWTAEDLAAEAIGQGLIQGGSWEEALSQVRQIMENIDE